MLSIKTIIFDNNGVLVTSNEDSGFKHITSATGISADKFKPIFDKLAKKMDKGEITSRECFERIIAELNIDIDPVKLERIVYGSFVRKEDVIKFIEELRTNYEIALLTNVADVFWELDERWKLTDIFSPEKIFISSEMGIIKPQRKIYMQMLKFLGREPNETIFVDDKKENVEAAESVGMKGIVFKDVSRLKQDLKKYITLQ